MTWAPEQIAAIVQQVLRLLPPEGAQLAASGVKPPFAGTPTIAATNLPVTTSDQVTAAKSASAQPHTLTLGDRLITMDLLRGRLAGVQCVRIGTRAIITPLVCDSLREQKILLERCPLDAPSPLRGRLGICFDSRKDSRGARHGGAAKDAVRVTNSLDASWTVFNTFDELLKALTESSASADVGSPIGTIAVTDDWARIAWLAAQHERVRAATVRSSQDAAEACEQIEANLLVVPLASATEPTLRAIAAIYQQCLATGAAHTPSPSVHP